MEDKISVVIIEPGKDPRHDHIENTLESLQKTVGGYIETVTLASDLVIVCDEEGRIKNKPYCCVICGVPLVGTVVICGVKGDEFADIPIKYERLKEILCQ